MLRNKLYQGGFFRRPSGTVWGRYLLLLWIVVWMLNGVQTEAQEDALVFRTFSTDRTLRYQTVTALTQSPDGFVWVGTTYGLYQYDGHDFVHWLSGSGRSGLVSPFVTDLLPQGDRYLWVATKEGLSRLDRTQDTFAHFTTRNVENFPSKIVHSVTLDDAGEGLWVMGDNRNPVLLHPETGILRSIAWKEYVQSLGLTDKVYLNVNRMQRSKDGRFLWMGTNIGLFSYSLQLDQFEYLGGKRLNGRMSECTALWEDDDGRVYVNVGGSGLQRYDPATGIWISWDVVPNAPTATDVFYGWDLKPYRDSLLLVGTTEGLMVFNTLRETFWIERHEKDQSHSLSEGGVLCLYADDAGLMWVGTQKGLSRIDPMLQQFKRVQVYENRDTVVQALWQDPCTGQVIMAPRGSGALLVWSPHTKQVQRLYAPDPGNKLFREITAFAADEGDGLWFCDWDRLFRLDLNTLAIEEHDITSGNYGFTDIQYASSKGVYLSSRYAGASHYDPVTRTFSFLKAPEFDFGLQVNSCFWDARDHSLWLPSNWGWLMRYQPEVLKWRDYRHFPDNPNSLASELPRRLVAGTRDDLWIITEPGGISRYWLESDSFTNYFTTEGLPVNLFDDFVLDAAGQLWLKYQHKICRWNSETWQAQVFDWRYGLEVPDWGAYFHRNQEGHILLGIAGGFLSFDPMRLTPNASLPRPTLQSVQVFDRDLPASEWQGGQIIELSHREHTFAIHFTALSYQLSEELRYYHLLEGADEDWREAIGGLSALYANLPPGEYRFRLKAINSDGVQAELDSPLEFRIRPHFSQTTEFRVFTLLLFFGFVYAVYRYRLNRMLEMERLRNRIAGDLHDDIASTISSISFYSAFAAEEARENPKLRAVLETIGRNSREALDKMRDIVWTIRSNDSSGLDLFQRMEYAGRSLCETRGVQFSLKGQVSWGQKTLSPELKKQLLLIFKEVLNNALQYSECKHFDVLIGREGNAKHWVEFKDDGCGFDPNAPRHGTGLKSLEWRTQQLGGEWKLQSALGEGTYIRVLW